MNMNFKEELKTTLTNCEDPFRAIKDIQDENGIALPQIKPALPLLDLLGVKRLDFHLAVLDDMKERLIKRIQELAQQGDKEQLEILLEKSFAVINLTHVTPIVMEIVKHMPRIPDKYVLPHLGEYLDHSFSSDMSNTSSNTIKSILVHRLN